MSAKLIRLPKVQEITGLARSTLYAMILKKQFPKPVKLSDTGRCVAWKDSDVEAWVASRKTA